MRFLQRISKQWRRKQAAVSDKRQSRTERCESSSCLTNESIESCKLCTCTVSDEFSVESSFTSSKRNRRARQCSSTGIGLVFKFQFVGLQFCAQHIDVSELRVWSIRVGERRRGALRISICRESCFKHTPDLASSSLFCACRMRSFDL